MLQETLIRGGEPVSRRFFWLVSLLMLLLAAGCNGPFGLMSGGKLDGEPRPIPENWKSIGESGQMQLETNPRTPYSVNVNYTVVDGNLYVSAGDSETEWVKNISADPAVRLRIEDSIYDLRAKRVTDSAEIARFGKVWTAQSMFMRDPTQFEEVWIYRMEPR
jgi:hypothetical protein